jgi:DNA-binding beta-propeller fold protein YncE
MTLRFPRMHNKPAIDSLFGSLTAFAIAAMSLCSPAGAETLYAVSVRTYADPAYKGVEGSLYRVDPDTGVTTLVAPLRLDGRDSIGLDGLAIHPKSGEFFGITAPTSALVPNSLTRLDRDGKVILIGNLGVASSDISFDAEGTLFAWLPETSQLGKIDLKTGAVTKVGTPRQVMATKGGFVVTPRGVAVIAASGAKGTLDSVDLKTGAITASVPLSGARYPELIAGLASSPKGHLYGVNTNGGTPARADLVKIDARTGQVTTVGPLPNDTDAITFGPDVEGEKSWDLDKARSLLFAVLAVFVIGLVITVSVSKLRRR